MENLPNDLEALKEIIRQLLEKNQRLEAENPELRRRLGMDSTNSHQSPSHDGSRKKTTPPGLSKKPGSGKGGQLGQKGRTLERVANPDSVEVPLPNQCERCRRPFGAEEKYEIIQSRRVFDLFEWKANYIGYTLLQTLIPPTDFSMNNVEQKPSTAKNLSGQILEEEPYTIAGLLISPSIKPNMPSVAHICCENSTG
jgi:hypothetical protein